MRAHSPTSIDRVVKAIEVECIENVTFISVWWLDVSSKFELLLTLANFNVDCFIRDVGVTKRNLLRTLVVAFERCGDAGDRFDVGDVIQLSKSRRGVFVADFRAFTFGEQLDDGVRKILLISFFGDRIRSGVTARSFDRFVSVRVGRLPNTVGLFSTSTPTIAGVRFTIAFSLFGWSKLEVLDLCRLVLDWLSCVAAMISSSSIAVELKAKFMRSSFVSFWTEVVDTDFTSYVGVVVVVLARFRRLPSAGEVCTSFGPLVIRYGIVIVCSYHYVATRFFWFAFNLIYHSLTLIHLEAYAP